MQKVEKKKQKKWVIPQTEEKMQMQGTIKIPDNKDAGRGDCSCKCDDSY